MTTFLLYTFLSFCLLLMGAFICFIVMCTSFTQKREIEKTTIRCIDRIICDHVLSDKEKLFEIEDILKTYQVQKKEGRR